MEQGATSIISLMIVTGIAFFIPMLLQRMKWIAIPVVVAEIIAGVIIGKSGFNIIDLENMWLGLLSSLGLIYLMFLSGVEIDFSSFMVKKKKEGKEKKKQANPFIVASFIFTLMLIFAFGVSLALVWFGLIEDPYFMTIILSTISLGIVVPVLKERKLIDTPLGQTILLIAVVSDFATMILFAYYLALKAGDTKVVWWILLLLGIVIALYISINYVKNKNSQKLFETLKKGTVQIGTRGVFALILFFVALSETMGIENILGAFLAGVIVSLLAPDKEFTHQLDSFGYGFLIPIFFVMVGVKLDMSAIFSNSDILALIPVVFILIYAVRMLPSLFLQKWFGWKNAISSGVILSSTMSLAIVAASVGLQMGIISEGLNSAVVLVSILTCFVSPIIYGKMAPEKMEQEKRITIIGSSRLTLLSSLGFLKEGYQVRLFTGKQEKVQTANETDHSFPIIELDRLDLESLNREGAFDCEKMIIATSKEEMNIAFAEYAKEEARLSPIVKIENPKLGKEYEEKGFAVYSDLYAGSTLLKAMVHSPGLMRFISQADETVREVVVKSDKYDNVPLRKIPFLGDVLILNIYRKKRIIVPHGDTKLKKGDQLIVSGNMDSVRKMTDEFS